MSCDHPDEEAILNNNHRKSGVSCCSVERSVAGGCESRFTDAINIAINRQQTDGIDWHRGLKVLPREESSIYQNDSVSC